MKRIIILSLFLSAIYACKTEQQNTSPQSKVASDTSIDYPRELTKVFDQHGGMDLWNSFRTLSYEIVKDGDNEKQTIDLLSRHEVIEASTFRSGYNGKEYWVEADTTYKGNPKFYTNLNFYFFAMPFVLADQGISYTPTEPLVFEGTEYPGYQITYGDGIGISPQDQYFIHYDPKTFKMAWLGYTVTYFSGEPSAKISWIHYNQWENFKGVQLPTELTWYNVEEGQITTPRKTRNFTAVKLSKEISDPSIFDKTANARVIE